MLEFSSVCGITVLAWFSSLCIAFLFLAFCFGWLSPELQLTPHSLAPASYTYWTGTHPSICRKFSQIYYFPYFSFFCAGAPHTQAHDKTHMFFYDLLAISCKQCSKSAPIIMASPPTRTGYWRWAPDLRRFSFSGGSSGMLSVSSASRFFFIYLISRGFKSYY